MNLPPLILIVASWPSLLLLIRKIQTVRALLLIFLGCQKVSEVFIINSVQDEKGYLCFVVSRSSKLEITVQLTISLGVNFLAFKCI